MRIWYNNQFDGFYPVGTAAVVVAENLDLAVNILNRQLKMIGLPESAEHSQFTEISTNERAAIILNDGNY